MSRKMEGERIDVYARITDRIIEDLERGVRPWMKPWNAAHTEGRITRPLRHSGTPYSGLNVLLLWSEGAARGFTSPMWMTFRQSLELGAAVRKGESGSTVVFASRFTKSQADGHGGEVDREIPSSRPTLSSILSRSTVCPTIITSGPSPFSIPSNALPKSIASLKTPAP